MVKQDTTKTTPEPKAKRIKWSVAANTAIAGIEGKTSLKDVAAAVDAMFVKHGGKSNIATATWHCRAALETAEAMGIVKLTRPTDVIVERVKK